MTKSQTVGIDSEDDSDDYDFTEADCELAMVQGQLCSLPYELYDLPDLTGILSVETWNSFLTEEERFFLSCFLPDMDQHTFNLTMHQLLGGANLYLLGNPMDKFYLKLRGGLFTPKVACYNEGVMFVKRKMYYYSLKLYHQKLIKTFTQMQRLWDQYETRTWNLKLLDLNRVPSGGIDSATCGFITPNVVKPEEKNRTKSFTFPRSGSSKNTLKIKITKKGILRYQGSNLVSSRYHHHQTLPKGLLKVVPKSSTGILGESCESPENNLLHIHEIGSKSTSFAASPYSGTRFVKPYETIAEFPKCLVNNQDTSFTYLETTQSSIDKTEPVLHDPTRTIPRGFGASDYSITEHNLSTKQEEYINYHLKSPGLKPGIVDRGTETREILAGKKFQREANVLRQPLHILSEDNHARKTSDDHLFSLTYKRRKIQRIVGS